MQVAAPRAKYWGGDPWGKGALLGIAGAFAVMVIALYAGLIRYGHWQLDEYQYVLSVRGNGGGFLWSRMFAWSPRPLSEALIFVYLSLADAWHSSWIAPVLTFCWALLGLAAFWPLGHGVPGGARRASLAVRCVLLGLFLVGHPVAEIFYWPMGALAYLPTLAAIVMMWSLADVPESSSRAPIIEAGLLMVAALSTEVGAVFAICHCGDSLFLLR